MEIEADWGEIISTLNGNYSLKPPIEQSVYFELLKDQRPTVEQLISADGWKNYYFQFDCGIGTSPSPSSLADYLFKASILGEDELLTLIDHLKKKEGDYELSLQATLGSVIDKTNLNSDSRLIPITGLKDHNIDKSTIYSPSKLMAHAQLNTVIETKVKRQWKIIEKGENHEFSLDEIIKPLQVTFTSLLLSFDNPPALRFDMPTIKPSGWAEGISTATSTSARSQVSRTSISEDQIKILNDLTMKLNDLSDTDFHKIWTAITRVCSSCVSGHPVDQLIELRIALEAIYTNTNNNIRNSLSSRIAKINAENIEDRVTLSKKVKLVYDICSTAVHSGTLHKKYDFETIKNVRQLAFENIKLFISNSMPDWATFDLE